LNQDIFVFTAGLLLTVFAANGLAQQPTKAWLIEVHGGAGDILRATTSKEKDAAYRATLTAAIQAGGKVLDQGGSSLDAVEAAIRLMENSDLFDTGRGAILNAAGYGELDSAIMDGATLQAGSVAAVTRSPHPITLARAVMEKTPHVLLVGAGANAFLHQIGGEEVEPAYLFSEAKWQALVNQLKQEGKPVPPRPVGAPPEPVAALHLDLPRPGERHYGTVGVVAMDRKGNLAAGTSTGGSQGKMPGRVGDSPIIGAGTYASNESCAVSATGVGEYFIRLTIARDVCSLVQYKGMPLQQAADLVIHKKLEKLHGVDGLIAITPDGQSIWSYNTPGMFRARLKEGGKLELSIYNDEP
jgi:beta-aspartyl-peptidase (threonine type)